MIGARDRAKAQKQLFGQRELDRLRHEQWEREGWRLVSERMREYLTGVEWRYFDSVFGVRRWYVREDDYRAAEVLRNLILEAEAEKQKRFRAERKRLAYAGVYGTTGQVLQSTAGGVVAWVDEIRDWQPFEARFGACSEALGHDK
jgi:hypothetical protein